MGARESWFCSWTPWSPWGFGCFGAPARRSPGEEGSCVQVAAARLHTDSQCCEGDLPPRHPAALPQGLPPLPRGDPGHRHQIGGQGRRIVPSSSGWGAAVVVVVGVCLRRGESVYGLTAQAPLRGCVSALPGCCATCVAVFFLFLILPSPPQALLPPSCGWQGGDAPGLSQPQGQRCPVSWDICFCPASPMIWSPVLSLR